MPAFGYSADVLQRGRTVREDVISFSRFCGGHSRTCFILVIACVKVKTLFVRFTLPVWSPSKQSLIRPDLSTPPDRIESFEEKTADAI